MLVQKDVKGGRGGGVPFFTIFQGKDDLNGCGSP